MKKATRVLPLVATVNPARFGRGHVQKTTQTMNSTAQKSKQRKTRAQRAADKQRANERARRVPGIFEFEVLVNDLYSPARGFATKKPRDDAWTYLKFEVGAYELRRHVEQKESVAVNWGQHANVRILDVDAHDGSDPRTVLPLLWRQVQALHLGRGRALPDFTGTDIPTNKDGSPVVIDGVIVTTERGLRYEEHLEPSEEDTTYADKMRVQACLERYKVEDLDGKVEVMPNQNGGSRLPLGYGCTFLYPPVGAVDLATGIEILSSLTPVPRDFVDFPFMVPRRDQDITTAEFIECTTVDEERICEYDTDEPTYPAPKNVVSECKPNLREQIYEGGDVPRKREGSSEFTVEAQRVRVEGASRGKRNREMYNQVFLHRCTKGMSREAVVAEMTRWIDDAPHTSSDLRDGSMRDAMIKQVHRLLNNIDAKLASGQLYQLGASCSSESWDPLLLRAETDEQRAAFTEAGKAELRRADDTSMLDGLPAWMQSSLPALVGAIKRYTVGGKIVLPATTVQHYARTKMSKKCPLTGEEKPAYVVLLEAAQRFGIIGGLISAGNAAKHKASVYESNVEEEEHEQRATSADVDPTGRVSKAESGRSAQEGHGSGTNSQCEREAAGDAREVGCCSDESRDRDACADVQGAVGVPCDDSPGQLSEHDDHKRVLPSKVRRTGSGRWEGATADDLDARRDRRDGNARLVS